MTTLTTSTPQLPDAGAAQAATLPRGIGTVRRADDDADYARLKIDRKTIAPWEDGQRESTERGHFEWWYFDAHLDDGASVVVTFNTKPTSNAGATLSPLVTINLTLADGRILSKVYRAKPDEFSASKAGCDVRIGANRFVGDLHRYRITASIEDVSVDIELVGEVPPWRPQTGHVYFTQPKSGSTKLFAWLVPVLEGRVTIDYRIGSARMQGTGVGYHDHNWGDAPMPKLMHDWYWARANVGPYSVVASRTTAQAEFGYAPQTAYLLAKDGRVVADDDRKVTFSTDRVSVDRETGKPVADITRYTYADGDERYVVTFERERTILRQVLADKLPFPKRILAKIAGVDSAYLRFSGRATVEKFDGDQLVESFSDPALWELMYLGHARPPAA
jgi:hypothetical protein